jgi:hypothetical protein
LNSNPKYELPGLTQIKERSLSPSFSGPGILAGVLLTILVFGLTSCSLFPHRVSFIAWPERVDRMRAFCDLDMSWKDMRYSGTMALTIEYPDRFAVEIYGPFGDTAAYLKKDENGFLFRSEEEKLTDEKRFEARFGIRLKDFMDDLAMRGLSGGPGTSGIVERNGYQVVYEFSGQRNRVCWRGADGSICVKFLEASFDGEGRLGKSSDRPM